MSVPELLAEVFGWQPDRSLIIGLGNTLRRDDGVGPWLIQHLRQYPELMAADCATRPEYSLDLLVSHQPHQIVFIDAADFGAPPGTLRLIKPQQLQEVALSSHRLPLAPLLEWIEQDYHISCHCLGIQAADMRLGEGLSPPVRAAAEGILNWFQNKVC